MKNSTATGTTATADPRQPGAVALRPDCSPGASVAPYRGRFAPSPTGPLHMGSLVAALASWLDARANGGTWLLRMEDLDEPRSSPGAATEILRVLDALGLTSDEPVLWQSSRTEAYAEALQQLQRRNLAYRCSCSRSDEPGAYSGHCRELQIAAHPAAWRFRLAEDASLTFDDAIQGRSSFCPRELGDPVIFRRDGLAAYQLAVAVDDAAQGITHVVRGADLLESTAWQLAISRGLGLPVPCHAHVPLVVEPDGTKLAKSRRSLAIATLEPPLALTQALTLLRQAPPSGLETAPISEILAWATRNWRISRLAGVRTIRAS